MIYFELFVSFMKIGFTSFGGMSMIPLIMEEVNIHHWMTSEDLTNLLAIAEMTPGPLGLNCATFAGMQSAGVAGAIAAVAGVLSPAFSLTVAVAICFSKFRDNDITNEIMSWVRPICIAMILEVLLTLIMKNYISNSRPDLTAIIIGGITFFLIMKRNWSVPRAILLAAILGIILYGVLGLS